jgi:uncharacterized phage-associated protein
VIDRLRFKFNREKALETLLYVARKARIPDRLHVCKILFFADRYHLENYLRFIYGETYTAMREGPVPSIAFNMMRTGPDEDPKDVFADDWLVIGRRDANLEVFSESDIEALDWAIEKYGRMSNAALRKAAHSDAVWQSVTNNGHAFDDACAPQSLPMPVIDIASEVEDGELLLTYLHEYA